MDKSIISDHLYNDSIPQAINYVGNIGDEETLFVYAYNYNWDNGFDIPNEILNNKCCSLSIALMLFLSSDGLLYLENKETDEGTTSWKKFVSNLYSNILEKKFPSGNVSFDPQLSKVQEFKIKKLLEDKEFIFITKVEGTNCYERL